MLQNPLTRRSFLASSASATAAAAFPRLISAAENKRMNLIMILCDDLGYGDLACFGAPDIRTPNLDRMASQGVRLTDYYSAAPVCTPARCALMTGRYQQRVPNLEWAIYPGVKTVGLPPRDTTIATMLKNAGYRTGLFGKWHLGYNEPNRPTQHGFEEFFGLLSGNVDFFRYTENNGEQDLYEGNESTQAEGYMTDMITRRSVDFIRRQAEAKEPFFLYTSYNAPHFPIQGPNDKDVTITKDNWGSQGNRETFAAMVEHMDAGIGEILDEVKKQGLDEDTFIVFCSDNGGERYGRNEPLSGKKGHLREGGIRVPSIMRWPTVIPEGKTSSQPCITMDISAMLLAAAQVRPTRHLDGVNMFPFICGEKPEIERTFLWRNGMHNEKAARWGYWKWVQEKGEDFLYYLPEDIGEKNNLIHRYRDIVYGIQSIHNLWEKAMPYKQTLFANALKDLDPPTF